MKDQSPDNLIVQRAARLHDARVKGTGSAREDQHMADSYGRYDGEGGGFMMGLLTGTVLGAGLGMLLAPKAGAELRGVIGEQARSWGSAASEQYRHAREAAGPWVEKGRDVVNQARETVTHAARDMNEGVSGYGAGATGSTYGTGTSGAGYSSPGSGYGAGTSASGGSSTKSDEFNRG